ncbi:RNA polymerase sigma-70 factor [Parabacteroides sp. Marseille-P3160]|uniref:RNA polymerase sigma-70 factor n=1 Tax=Parabacteroides sp. Marseille-P3160 TaxID=1917887 RepID=UPI0009BA22EB|nr:RNA polymerase sigma-70 factor [Parabacteroides sp. Marseille-P3160]
MEKNNSIDDLFRRIAFRDDDLAFKELFFSFYPSLCVFAGRYIFSPETCEDIVQDTFFKLWKNRKTIEITSSFRNFLITTVKNNCTDYLRRESVQQNYVRKQAASSLNDDTPEEIYTVRELEELLRIALEKMPENVRVAFEMSRLKNMSYTQIAQEMAVSPRTVESYISKALTILRVELKDYFLLLLLLYPGFFNN